MVTDAQLIQVHNQAVDMCVDRMKIKLDHLSRRLGYADAAWVAQALQDSLNNLKK